LPVAMAHCTNDLSIQMTYFLDMILVWMLQKIFCMVISVKPQLNSPYVEDMDNNPLHYCHVSKCGVRQLYTQAENYCDFIVPYWQVFAGGGKTRDAMITSVTMRRNPVEVASRMVQNLPQMTWRFTVGDLNGSKKSNEIVSFGQNNYMESIPRKAFSG
jgi:hypothetical protein